MLNRIPRSLPSLSTMLDDVGQPTAAALARALRVSTATARRWIKADEAPYAVMVAIFWITRWGLSAVDAEAQNAATMWAAYAGALKDELAAARRQVERLEQQLGHHDEAANAPNYEPLARRPLIESGSALRICHAMMVATT